MWHKRTKVTFGIIFIPNLHTILTDQVDVITELLLQKGRYFFSNLVGNPHLLMYPLTKSFSLVTLLHKIPNKDPISQSFSPIKHARESS